MAVIVGLSAGCYKAYHDNYKESKFLWMTTSAQDNAIGAAWFLGPMYGFIFAAILIGIGGLALFVLSTFLGKLIFFLLTVMFVCLINYVLGVIALAISLSLMLKQLLEGGDLYLFTALGIIEFVPQSSLVLTQIFTFLFGLVGGIEIVKSVIDDL